MNTHIFSHSLQTCTCGTITRELTDSTGVGIVSIGNKQFITRSQHNLGTSEHSASLQTTLSNMEPLKTKYAHVFVDGEDQYVFVRVLGTGRDASAQLVIHAQTGELFVRKVDKRLLDEQETEKEDNERILFLVQSQARARGVELNTAHLFSAEDIPAPQRRGRSYIAVPPCQIFQVLQRRHHRWPS